MDGKNLALQCAEELCRIIAAARHPGDVDFGLQFRACRIEQQFKRRLAVELDHFKVVIVVGHGEACRRQFVRISAELLAQGGPACGVLRTVFRLQERHGHDRIADGLLLRDDLVEIAAQLVDRHVRRNDLDLVLFEKRVQFAGADLLHVHRFHGGNACAVEDGKLFFQRSGIAQRVHLRGDRQRLAVIGKNRICETGRQSDDECHACKF
ncbi:hypothetical protein D3C71_1557980 [compost metagenome]